MTNVLTLETKQPDVMTPYDSGPLQTGRITIIVDGRTPLLTHNPQSMGVTKGPSKQSRIPDPADEAEAGCYRQDDGTLCIKGDSFRGALLSAAGAWKTKGKATMKSRLGHIVVTDELIALKHKDGTPITSFEIDQRRVMVQKSGIIRSRPKFTDWSCQLTIEFDPLLVTEPTIICDILNDAGGRIGVGDFRPSKNGWFGRFSVRSYHIEQ
jgi:hypothetical protein